VRTLPAPAGLQPHDTVDRHLRRETPLATIERSPASARPSFWSYLRSREIDVYPAGALRWLLLLLVVLAWTIEQFESLKMGPVLVYMLDELDVTIASWGYVLAIAAVCYGLGSFVLSRLADRFGRRPMLIWPVALYAVVSVGAALAPGFMTLAVFTFCGALLIAGMSPAVHAASRDLSPRLGRAMAYSWISLAFTLGALLATAVAARTLPIWPGWRPQFWIAAVFAVVTALVLAVFYRDLSSRVRGQILRSAADAVTDPRATLDPDRPAAYYDGTLVYRSGRLWMLGTTLLFWSLAYATVAAYVPTSLTQHFQIEPAKAAGITSYFWLVFTVSVFVSGWISDRTQVRKTVTAAGGLATGLCYFIGAALPVGTPYWKLAVVWSLTGWCAGFIYPAWCALFSETAEQVTPFGVARAFGFVGLLYPLAGITLNLGLPQVVARWGWPAWMQVAGASCVMCAILVAFGHGAWWVRSGHGE
jgi:OPA family glycerol-3-phosphate transporter-like MFS transporter